MPLVELGQCNTNFISREKTTGNMEEFFKNTCLSELP